MKVFTLAILLVSVYCMEGANVKRQAQAQAEAEPSEQDIQQAVQSYLQSVSQFFTEDLAKQAKLEDLKTQAEAFIRQAHGHLAPLAEQLRERAAQFFSSIAESIPKKS